MHRDNSQKIYYLMALKEYLKRFDKEIIINDYYIQYIKKDRAVYITDTPNSFLLTLSDELGSSIIYRNETIELKFESFKHSGMTKLLLPHIPIDRMLHGGAYSTADEKDINIIRSIIRTIKLENYDYYSNVFDN